MGRTGHGSIRLVYEGSKTIDEVREMQRQRHYPGERDYGALAYSVLQLSA